MPESLFNKVAGLACNVIKKETLAQVFSSEFCEISKNIFFHRPLPVAASDISKEDYQKSSKKLTSFLYKNPVSFYGNYHKKIKGPGTSYESLLRLPKMCRIMLNISQSDQLHIWYSKNYSWEFMKFWNWRITRYLVLST